MSKVSVLTSTFNSESCITQLIESLIAQTSSDFQWVISDGESSDATLEIINSYNYEFPVIITSRKDFGIYDSLNKGLLFVESEYYLVVGSDDILFSDTIQKINQLINVDSSIDIYSMSLIVGKEIIVPQQRPIWFYGMRGICTSHSVGLLIKRDLHNKIGFYSNRYPICADQFFILSAYKQGYKFRDVQSIISGKYSIDGTSGIDIIGTLSENYRIQIRLFDNLILQTFIYFCRVIKNIKSL